MYRMVIYDEKQRTAVTGKRETKIMIWQIPNEEILTQARTRKTTGRVGEKYGWLVYQDGLVALYNILTAQTILGHPAPSAPSLKTELCSGKGVKGGGGAAGYSLLFSRTCAKHKRPKRCAFYTSQTYRHL
jgi:hypothetical protein